MGAEGEPTAGRSRRLAIRGLSASIVALIVLAAWIWSPGLAGPYQFDDHATPLSDPASQSLAAVRVSVTPMCG